MQKSEVRITLQRKNNIWTVKMADEINFETWAKDCDRSPDAIEVLKKEELDSLATLQSLSDKTYRASPSRWGKRKGYRAA